jgi:hypothetical protein
MEGDGFSDSYHVNYTTVSKKLGRQVCDLWRRLGYNAQIRFSSSEIRPEVYTVQRPVKGRQYGCHVKGNGMFVKIKKMFREMIEEPVFNLSVDGDNSYVVGDVAVANCLQPMGLRCPLCDYADTHGGSFSRYKGAFFTIIDTNKFTDKSGKERSNLKKLLVAKKDTAEILKRKYLGRVEAGGGLKFAMFNVFRTNSDKSASVGEDFEFVKMIDPASIADTSELDYVTLLKPNPESVARIAEMLNRTAGTSSGSGKTSSDSGKDGTEDRVKF